MSKKIKDWQYALLDSGHWIAVCGELESPIACRKSWVKAWVKSYCTGKTVFTTKQLPDKSGEKE